MKIVIAGTAYPYRGGLAAYNERLAREFISEGNEVEILTFKLQYPSFLFPGKTQFSEANPPPDIRIRRILNSVNPFNWIRTGLIVKKMRPDILIFKYWLPFMAPCFGTIARIAAGNKHTKVICIFDNVIPHEKRPGDRILTKYFLKPLDAAVAMSQKVMNDFKGFKPTIPAKLSPHPLFDNFGEDPGKEISCNHLAIESRFNYILFFGFIRAYKGLDLLLEAFASSRVRTEGNVKLIIAGEFYENAAPYMKIIEDKQLIENVLLFTRFINDDEVKYFFGASDLVVQPYKNATQSGVTQIAYHFNKPMVVTDVGGLREIVPDGKCGFVVDKEPGAISGAIDRFFQGNIASVFAKGISEEKKRYAWNKMTGAVIELYKKISDHDNKK